MNRRLAALLSLLLLALVVPAGAASAAGTGDVELVPAPRDGERQSSFRVEPDEQTFTFDLLNLADAPRTVRLYGADASESPGGATSVGAAGSAPWMLLEDREVTLAAKEVRSVTVRLDPERLPEEATQLGVVVLEAPQGAITVRVATLVTVEPRAPFVLPLWLVLLAAGSIATTALGLLLARRRRTQDEPAPELAPELVAA